MMPRLASFFRRNSMTLSISRCKKTKQAPRDFIPGRPCSVLLCRNLTYGSKFPAVPKDLLSESIDKIVHGRISVARRQWREIKPEFQKL